MQVDLNSLRERKWLVLINGLTGSVSDHLLENLFSVFGRVKMYKRVKDGDGKALDFGFVQFSDEAEVLKCAKTLDKSKFDFPKANEPDEHIELSVSFDKAIRASVAHSDKLEPIYGQFEERLQAIRADIQRLKSVSSKTSVLEIDVADDADLYRGIPESRLTAEQKAIVDKEISLFKLVEPVMALKKDFKEGVYSSRSSSRSHGLQNFESMLERFNAQRARRIAIREQESASDSQRAAQQEADYKFWFRYLATFDDDEAEKRVAAGTEVELPVIDYYKDPVRWWKRRKVDRLDENDELLWQEYLKKQPAVLEAPSVSVSKLLKKLQSKSTGATALPKDDSEVLDFAIEPSLISSEILTQKIEPFVKQLVVEYLGEEDDDMIDFILRAIKSDLSHKEYMKELSSVFEDEAEEILLKLKKFLISVLYE